MTPLIVADLMRGSGRFNLALGAVGTVQGIGASLSGLSAGLIVDHFGYNAAFLIAAGVAAVALLGLAVAMPETGDLHGRDESPIASLALANVKSTRADLD